MRSKTLCCFTIGLLGISISACATLDPTIDENDEIVGTGASAIIGGSLADDYPESVLIEMKRNGTVVAACSGSLIAPRVALTAGHCVHKFDGWNVTAPYASTQNAQSTSGAVYDWESDGELVDGKMHDVGLIFLNTPIKLAAYPRLTDAPLEDGSKMVNIGRIDNGSLSKTDLYVSKPLAVSSAHEYGFPHYYIAKSFIEQGDSGGPDMIAGTHTIAAVNSGSGNGVAVFARVDLVLSWIDRKIAAHGGNGKKHYPE